jgi:hypothetical protein
VQRYNSFMKNKTLRAENLQKVALFFNLRPYLYIILGVKVKSWAKKEWRKPHSQLSTKSYPFSKVV